MVGMVEEKSAFGSYFEREGITILTRTFQQEISKVILNFV